MRKIARRACGAHAWLKRLAVGGGIVLFPLLSGCGLGPDQLELESQSQAVTCTGCSVGITTPSANAMTGDHDFVVSGTFSKTSSQVVSGVWARMDFPCGGTQGAYTAATFVGGGSGTTSGTWSVIMNANGSSYAPGSGCVVAKVALTDASTNWSSSTSNPLTIESGLPAVTTGQVYRVTTVAELNSRLASGTLREGDYIVAAPGTYTITAPLNVSLDNSVNKKPIVVTAEYVGTATIAGTQSSGFQVYALTSQGAPIYNVTIRGFNFTHTQDYAGTAVATTTGRGMLVRNCNGCRVTRNKFALSTTWAPTSQNVSDWLIVDGGNTAVPTLTNGTIVDHNSFQNKATRGNFAQILGTTGIAVTNSNVHHNYFLNQTQTAATNGGECLRLGNEPLAMNTTGTLIESNLFDNCDGDSGEMISIKTSGNQIRFNTFKNSKGSLSLRHGNGSTVEGNFLIGGQQGIRAYGHDHKIVNNYLENNDGLTVSQPIVLMNGDVSGDDLYPTYTNKHAQAQNVTVAFNTIYKNNTAYSGSHMHIGYTCGGGACTQNQVCDQCTAATGLPLNPTNCKIGNNIIRADSGSFVNMEHVGTGTVFEGNLFYGAATSSPPAGFTRQDPMLSFATGIWRLSTSSPKDNSVGSYTLTLDDDGESRVGTKDVGADEYSAVPGTSHKPLTSADVGQSAP